MKRILRSIAIVCLFGTSAFGAEPKEPYRIFREAVEQIMLPREESTPAYHRVGPLLRIAKEQRSVGDDEGVEHTLKCAHEIIGKTGDEYEKSQSLQYIAAFEAGKMSDDSVAITLPFEQKEKTYNMQADPAVIASITVNRGDFSRSLSMILHELVQKDKIAEGFLLLDREARNVTISKFDGEEAYNAFLESAAEKFPPDKLLELAEMTKDETLRKRLVADTVLAVLRKRFGVRSMGGWISLSLSRLVNIAAVWKEFPDVFPDWMARNIFHRPDFDMQSVLFPEKMNRFTRMGFVFPLSETPEPHFDPMPYIERIEKPFPKAMFVALYAAELYGNTETEPAKKEEARKMLRETYENLRQMDEKQLFADAEKIKSPRRFHFDEKYGLEFYGETGKILVLANALMKVGEKELAGDALQWVEGLVRTDNERTWLAASWLRLGNQDRYESLRKQIVPNTFKSRSTHDEYATFLEVFALLGMEDAVLKELERFPSEKDVSQATDRNSDEKLARMSNPDDMKWMRRRDWYEARKEWITARTRADLVFVRKSIDLIRGEKHDEAWSTALNVYSPLTRLTLLEGIALEREKRGDSPQSVVETYEKIVRHALALLDETSDFDKKNLDSNERNYRFCYVLDFNHPFVRVALDEKDYREAFERVSAIWRNFDPENDHLIRASKIAKSGDFDRAIRNAKAIACRDLDLAALGYVAARQFDAGLKEAAEQTLRLAESRIGTDSNYKGNSYHYSGNMMYPRPMGFPELVRAMLFCDQSDRAVEWTLKQSGSNDSSTTWQAQRSMVDIVLTLYEKGRNEKMLDALDRFQQTGRLPEWIWSELSRITRPDGPKNDDRPDDPAFVEKIETVLQAAFDGIGKEPELLEKGSRYCYFAYLYNNLGATEKYKNAERLAEEAIDAFEPRDFETARRKSSGLSSLAFYRDDIVEKEELYFKSLRQFRLFPRERTWGFDSTLLSPVDDYARALIDSRQPKDPVIPAAAPKEIELKNEDIEKKKWSVFWVESGMGMF